MNHNSLTVLICLYLLNTCRYRRYSPRYRRGSVIVLLLCSAVLGQVWIGGEIIGCMYTACSVEVQFSLFHALGPRACSRGSYILYICNFVHLSLLFFEGRVVLLLIVRVLYFVAVISGWVFVCVICVCLGGTEIYMSLFGLVLRLGNRPVMGVVMSVAVVGA